MTSKNFSSNKLLWNNMRRNAWTLVLSIFAFLVSQLLPMLMTMQSTLEYMRNSGVPRSDIAGEIESMGYLLAGQNPFVKCAFIVLAVVCGVAMFSYLHSRQKVDFYHSMPITRTRLYINQFVTGIVSVVVGYLVVLAITIAVTFAMGFGDAVDWVQIGGAVACNLIIFFLLYALTVVTTIVCGNTIVSLLLLIWTMFSLLIARLLYLLLCDQFLVTHVGNDLFNEVNGYKLSPIAEYFMLEGTQYRVYGYHAFEQSAVGLLAIYLLIAIAVTILGWYLFRIRKSERAGMALAFEPIRLPLKVYMCVVMGVAVSLIFRAIGGWFWFWPGLVIGTVLFHGIVEMIYAFDMKAILAKPLHLACILTALIVGILMMQADVFGYDTRLPKKEEVQAIGISYRGMDRGALLEEEQNVEAVYALMKRGVENVPLVKSEMKDGYYYDRVSSGDGSYTSYIIRYRKANGRMEARNYLIDMSEKNRDLLRKVVGSEEYKKKYWSLFMADIDNDGLMPMLTTIDNADNVTNMRNDPAKAKEIIETLREETLQHDAPSRPVLRMEIELEERETGSIRNSGTAFVTEKDVKTLALIKNYMGIEPQKLSVKDIDRLIVNYSVKSANDTGGREYTSVDITDKKDIEKVIANTYNRSTMYEYGGSMFEELYRTNDISIEVNSVKNDYYGLAYIPEQELVEVLAKYGVPTSQDGAAPVGATTDQPVEAVPYAQ